MAIDQLEVVDRLDEVKYLLESIHMMANSPSLHREESDAFQIVIRHAKEGLATAVRLLSGGIEAEAA